MSILIAGATGAIGRSVVKECLSFKSIHRVVALTRQAPTIEKPVEVIFGLPFTTTSSPSTGVEKLAVTTFDWEHFMLFWDQFSRTSIEEQEMIQQFVNPSSPARKETTAEGETCIPPASSKYGSNPFAPGAALLPHGVYTANVPGVEAYSTDVNPEVVPLDCETDPQGNNAGLFCEPPLPHHLRSLKKDYEHYKNIFSGHNYAAICLGTTKKDAGGMKQFIRCDYTYVLAFTEALLCFSGPAGWDVIGDDKKFQREEEEEISYHSPSWLSYRVKEPSLPSDVPWVTSNTSVRKTFSKFYNQTRQTQEVIPFLRQRSSQTLRGITLVSSTGASPSSWIGYLQTKGATEEGVAERLSLHNQMLRSVPVDLEKSSNKWNKSLCLHILRPGSLNRGDKARGKEKFVNIIMFNTSIKVETCAVCIVKNCLASLAEKPAGEISASMGKPYPNKKTFAAANEQFFYYGNSEIYSVEASSVTSPLSSTASS